MFELSFNSVKKYLDANLILQNVSFNIFDGEKVGIVGINGCGKSTILKLMAGIHTMTKDDKGLVLMPRGATVAYLEQSPSFDGDLKVKEVLNLAFKKADDIELEMRTIENKMNTSVSTEVDSLLKKYAKLQSDFETIGGYEKAEKLSKVCIGLNFSESFLEKQFDLLSGGEKTTVILGKILLENPDILLLDEPTNHLDIDSIENLEETLDNFNCTLFFISHDRYFINKIATTIIEADNHKLKKYNGNYDYFKHEKTKLLAAAKEADAQKEKVVKPKQVKQRDPQPKKKNVYKITKLEEKIEELENTLKQIEQDMAENSTNYDKLNDLYKTKTDTESELESAMTEWEGLQ